MKYSDTGGTSENTVLAQQRPYGTGRFGEAGFQTVLRYDGTDPKSVLGRGIQTKVAGTYYAKAWDVERHFGSLEGEFTGNLPLGRPTQLSLRAGGKKLWGDYPFFEAAYIGGAVIHGYNWNRYAGDSSLYSSLGFKWAFAETHGSIPMEIGLSLGSDAGRVWRSGENSSKWHTGETAGIFIAPFSRLTLFELGVGKSKEKTFLVFGANLRFAGF
jgi:hemolysin activation/secretion protein